MTKNVSASVCSHIHLTVIFLLKYQNVRAMVTVKRICQTAILEQGDNTFAWIQSQWPNPSSTEVIWIFFRGMMHFVLVS